MHYELELKDFATNLISNDFVVISLCKQLIGLQACFLLKTITNVL